MNFIVNLKNSTLIRSAGIYTVAGVINGSIIFFLMPFLTRYLSTEEYGIVSIFRTLITFTFPIIGFFSSVSRMFFEKDNIDFPRYIGNTVVLIFINTVLVSILIFIFADPIHNLTTFPTTWLWAIVLYSIGHAFIGMILVLWQVQVKSLAYGTFQITLTCVNFIASLGLVIYVITDWRGVLIGDSTSYALFGLLAIIFLYKGGWFRLSWKKDYIKDILAYNIPIVFHLIGRSIITMSDKVFITKMVGISETGIYTAGYQIGMIVFVITTAFQNAWLPHLYSKLKLNNFEEKKKIVKQIYIYIVLILLFGFMLGMIAPWFVSFFLGKDFGRSSEYVLLISMGFAFNGIYIMLSSFITFVKKTHLLATITVISTITSLCLNYILIKFNGTFGAAQTIFITFLVMAVFTWIISARVYKMPWLGVFKVS